MSVVVCRQLGEELRTFIVRYYRWWIADEFFDGIFLAQYKRARPYKSPFLAARVGHKYIRPLDIWAGVALTLPSLRFLPDGFPKCAFLPRFSNFLCAGPHSFLTVFRIRPINANPTQTARRCLFYILPQIIH